MRIKNIIKPLAISLLLLTLILNSFAQVVVERSKEKVIISGIPFYIHLVKKGETSYSISKAYGISVEELTKENPPALYGIIEGQTLRIPVKPDAPQDQAKAGGSGFQNKQAHDETKFIYHSLKPGETVYALSKSYGVSENEIIQSNSGIDINKLPVGAEIAVPRRVFMSNREKFDEQEKKYFFHKVEKGESLGSIADKYGLTTRQLRKENRDLRFPQAGDFVRIPGRVEADVLPEIKVNADTIQNIIETPINVSVRPAGFTEVKDLRGTLNIAVLLPFYLRENSKRVDIDSSKSLKGKIQYKANRKPEEWISPRSLDFLEMYNGILIAADTLRTLGLNINISTYDIRSDTLEISSLIGSGKLSAMDLIIGPVYSHNLSIVARYCEPLGIPVVSPVTLINNSVLDNNPTVFMANSSLEVDQRLLARQVGENYNKNIVFIHNDTSRTDSEVKKLKELIFKELTTRLPYEEIRFKELPFISRSMFDNDSINRLSHALSEKTGNIIVIASEEAPVISETITDIHGLSKKFDVKVFGYPSVLDIENLNPKILFELDMVAYSPYFIDYSRQNVQHFNSNFRRKFLTEPMEKSPAWLGYDITYYFLSGISMHGKSFISSPGIHHPELLQTDFDFERKNPGSGFENVKLFLLRYTKDYEVKNIE